LYYLEGRKRLASLANIVERMPPFYKMSIPRHLLIRTPIMSENNMSREPNPAAILLGHDVDHPIEIDIEDPKYLSSRPFPLLTPSQFDN